MNQHPIELIMPLFDSLDAIIRDHGVSIYVAMVWLAPFVIAWILSGGFRRKRARHEHVTVTLIPPTLASSTPPPLPDDDSSSFAA